MNQQRTVVALNGDIVGYSRLMADSHESTAALVELFQRLVADQVSVHHGTLVNFVGDNFMAVFEDTAEAVQAALSITSEIERRDPRIASEPVRFRMGLDAGSVSVSGTQFYGDVLNVAARIQAIAKPGGISVSGRVYRILDEPSLRFRAIGKQRLKNIPETVEVYEFADLPITGNAGTERTPLHLESPTVAVLPIHVKHSSEQVVDAAEMLRRELLHRLATIPGLKAVNAQSVIGQEKGLTSARYMIETGVYENGFRVRVFATLFDVITMNVVKSYKWFVSPEELFDLPERFAEEVARSIEVELVVGEPAGLYAELNDPEAIEKIYLGWYHLRSDTREGWTRALDLFEQVSLSHPNRPYGHVLSAFALWLGAANEWAADTVSAMRKAHDQALRARKLNDPTGMAQAIEGAILMSQGKHDEALAAIEELEILRPTCDVTYGLEGSIRRYLGQWEKSVDLLNTAMRLTGINKPWYPTVKACSLFIGEKLEEAMLVAEMVIDHQPNNLEAYIVLAAAQAELGMERRAKATVDSIRERFPSVDAVAWLDKHPYANLDRVRLWKDSLSAIASVH
ncbi:MAG: adenylate/guanylate cyclase domain-containing protein [Desulfofustis sp.]|nr:adenylate/guanylate cyclase domain-containing protein [Desulfofustis sp.]